MPSLPPRPQQRAGSIRPPSHPTESVVAWIGPALNADGTPAEGDGLYVQELEKSGASPVRINASDLAKSDVAEVVWSADSRMLAFLCASASGQSQVCVAGADGQSARKLTDLKATWPTPRGLRTAKRWPSFSPRMHRASRGRSKR